MPFASYAVDIGVFNVGSKGQILATTTTAWARSAEGSCSFEDITFSGSHEEGRFAQATGLTWCCGRSIRLLVGRITADIEAGFSVSIGLEAPMWFPIEREEHAGLKLFKPRFREEGGSEWYLQSGAAATIKAISIGTMLIDLLVSKLPEAKFTTAPSSEPNGTIILYEAFVVGEGKFKMPLPSGAVRAENEWDAFTASLAWGAINCEFEIPHSIRSRELHKAGSSDSRIASVWQVLASLTTTRPLISGPPDCQIVGVCCNAAGL